VAITTTTAAATHTARISFSMAVWSGRLVRFRLQEQALRSSGRGLPNSLRRQEASSTRTNLFEPCWNVLVCPSPALANGKCRTTAKTREAFSGLR
jgi:hypothetical protein